MKLPLLVQLLGYSGLLPFFAGPLWLTVSPETAPAWLDRVWANYVALTAAFMAGTYWGFALPASPGVAGKVGIGVAVLLLLGTVVATALPHAQALAALGLLFLLLLVADVWRERMLDTIDGYFALRTTLTLAVLGAIAWRFLIAPE